MNECKYDRLNFKNLNEINWIQNKKDMTIVILYV